MRSLLPLSQVQVPLPLSCRSLFLAGQHHGPHALIPDLDEIRIQSGCSPEVPARHATVGEAALRLGVVLVQVEGSFRCRYCFGMIPQLALHSCQIAL
jgi:hypothetical protein